jgi:hypothetical protein
MQGRILSVILLLMLSMGGALAAEDDEAWIERQMSRPGQSAAPAKIQAGYRIGWSELGGFVGQQVKVQTRKGGAHHGVLERVQGQRMFLRARSYGGYADLVLRADQVLSTELE